jgi:hypothetical protein
MKKHNLSELQQLYVEAEAADSEVFAEQRSNILLIAGEHYARRGSRFWNRVRDAKELSSEQKLRITKNHIQKIYKIYVNNILRFSPGVEATPKNDSELEDQKAAEMHNSVWQDICARKNMRDKTRQWAEDFVGIGETFVKVFFDNNQGTFKGMAQAVDENGNPIFDENGNPAPSDNAVFSGDIVYERIFGANILRDPGAKSFSDSEWLCYRKMVPLLTLKNLVKGDEKKEKWIVSSSDDTFKVFDGGKTNYVDTKNQTLVKEFYFKPCPQYPKGYYYITVQGGILFEGELPGGLFPIIGASWDEIQTSPRGRSIIKQLRPYQAEINRTASKIAETQITLGDDKLLVQSGSKLAPGGVLPGIRGIQYTGIQPGVLMGRSGDQYVGYMNGQIDEMYFVADIEGDSEDKPQQVDVYTQLYQSIKDKKKFMVYGQKFETFLREICMLSLKLAKLYYEEDMVIAVVGKNEQINIPVFKSAGELGYQIKLQPVTDDVESMMGKQLTLNHILQYVGPQLGKDDIGKIIRSMPFANSEEAFNDMTIDYDNSVSDILSMDRGEYRPALPNENHEYMLKRLAHRMKQRSFEFLAPEIQEMYARKVQEHEYFMAENLEKIRLAEAGFIPTDGYLVTVDFYVTDPKDPNKTNRARIPYESIKWLLERLEVQGKTQESLETLEQGTLASLSERLTQGMQSQQMM